MIHLFSSLFSIFEFRIILKFYLGLGIKSETRNLNRIRTEKPDPKCKKYLNGSCRVLQNISEPEVLLTEPERVTRKPEKPENPEKYPKNRSECPN